MHFVSFLHTESSQCFRCWICFKKHKSVFAFCIIPPHWKLWYLKYLHYNDVTMRAMASQITGISTDCSTVCSGTHHRKHQSSASLAFVRGMHRRPVDSLRKGPVTWKMFPFHDVIMFIVDDKFIPILYSWWRGSARGHGVSNTGTDLVLPEYSGLRTRGVDTLRVRQNGRHFPDDIFNCILLDINYEFW